MFDFKAQGIFSWIVLNEKNKIVSKSEDSEFNLVLNQGLNGIAVRTWAESFKYAAVGTGSSSPNAFDVSLVSETMRTGTYLSGACGTTYDGNDYRMKRTFVFPSISVNKTYTEAGFSYSEVNGSNLFSRIKLPSVFVKSGFRLVLQYELFVRLLPKKAKTLTNPISKVNFSGSYLVQKFGLAKVNYDGGIEPYDDSGYCNEPSSDANLFISWDSLPLSPLGSSADRSSTSSIAACLKTSYVNNSYTITKYATIKSNFKNPITSFGIGGTSPAKDSGVVFKLDGSWKKPAGMLTLHFTYTWSRFTRANYTSLYYWRDDAANILKGNPLLSYYELNDE